MPKICFSLGACVCLPLSSRREGTGSVGGCLPRLGCVWSTQVPGVQTLLFLGYSQDSQEQERSSLILRLSGRCKPWGWCIPYLRSPVPQIPFSSTCFCSWGLRLQPGCSIATQALGLLLPSNAPKAPGWVLQPRPSPLVSQFLPLNCTFLVNQLLRFT